jgi:hypothetical protein
MGKSCDDTQDAAIFRGIKRAQNIIILALSLFEILIRQVNVTESEKNDDDNDEDASELGCSASLARIARCLRSAFILNVN